MNKLATNTKLFNNRNKDKIVNSYSNHIGLDFNEINRQQQYTKFSVS